MAPLLSKLSFNGRVHTLLKNPDRERGLEKHEVTELNLLFSGIEGDSHGGFIRKSDSRMLKQYKRGTEVRNSRQVSLVSIEELGAIAETMRIPSLDPSWLGANMVTEGIPDLTLLPPSSRLQFPSGATIVIDLENLPCRYPAEIIARHHPNPMRPFIAAATGKRGLVGWIESEGTVGTGDHVVVWIPPQRNYSHI